MKYAELKLNFDPTERQETKLKKEALLNIQTYIVTKNYIFFFLNRPFCLVRIRSFSFFTWLRTGVKYVKMYTFGL